MEPVERNGDVAAPAYKESGSRGTGKIAVRGVGFSGEYISNLRSVEIEE